MLTIFATPKAFTDPHINIIQRNAFKSWKLISPWCQIILFGNDKGTKEVASEFGFEHIDDIKRNKYGTPLLDSIFEKIESAAKFDVLMYINCDIMMTDDFGKTLEILLPKLNGNKFLIGGERWDTDIKENIDFNDAKWKTKLRNFVEKNSTLHGPTGIDYFVFNKGLFGKVPPFAIGRFAWDSWLIWKARKAGAFVINATPSIMAIHQNHPPPIDKGSENNFKEERRINTELAGKNKLHLDDANHIFKENMIKKTELNFKLFKRRFFYTWPALHPMLRPAAYVTRLIFAPIRK